MTKKNIWLLLKKNLIVEYRSYLETLLEIITILAIFYILFQIKPHETVREDAYVRTDMQINDLSQFKNLMFIKEDTIPYKLYYTPKNNDTENVLKITARNLNLMESVGFDNENDMIEQFDSSSVLAGVILHPHNITLRFPNYFRTRHNRNFYKVHDFWLARCMNVLAENKGNNANFYLREGFLQLLYSIVKTQMEVGGHEIPMQIYSIAHSGEPKVDCINDLNKAAPTPERFLMWSLCYFIYFLPFINLIWKFSREHEENIFFQHWIYGIRHSGQMLAQFIVSLIHFICLDAIVFTLIIFLWRGVPVWKFVLLFPFLIMHNVLLILYAMILSSAIRNARTTVWFGVTLWITSFAVLSEMLNITSFDILIYKILIVCVIFFNNSFPHALLDYFGEGDKKSINEITILFGVHFSILVLYGCLLKYIEHKWPGDYGRRCPSLLQEETLKKCDMNLSSKFYETHIEYGPVYGEVLELKNVYSHCEWLHKGPQLRNLSMRFFTNEISVVLGPHNSGKTNLIRLLAGWQDYKGLMTYKGHDIVDYCSDYRQHVAVSMANNPLFDRLTIQETLKYFILLKRKDTTELKFEWEKWLNVMKPIAYGKALVKTLSFGEKRILALCCAMACNTSVVLLDEPTVHMVADDQYRYWDILKQEKQDRAIIVTTFSVDEANELGDRIAILADGYLIAWGTSYFLRNKFGNQFYLVCFLQPRKPIEPITALLENFTTNLAIHNHFTDRVIYTIPANKKFIFQRLLIQLEKNASDFGITKIYMTGNGLNEVYMKALASKRDLSLNKVPDIGKALQPTQGQRSKMERHMAEALFYKKLLLQSNNILTLSIIFISFILVLVFSQMSAANFNIDSIMFSGHGLIKDENYSLIEITKVDDIGKGLFRYENVEYLNDSYEKRSRKNYNSFAALEVKNSSITVWCNEKIFHSAPLAVHLASNYLSNASTFINRPIMLRNNYYIHIILGTINPLTMSVVFVNLQDERFSNMFSLQKVAGLNDQIKWSVTFLWDLTISLLISLLYLIIIIVFVMEKSSLLIVIAALILFFLSSIASLLFIYIVSLFMAEDCVARGIIKIFLLQLILGLLPYVVYTNILQNYDVLLYLYMLLPGFSVLYGTNRIFDNHEIQNLSSYFQWYNPGILDSIFFISLTSGIYFMLFVAVNVYRRFYFESTPKRIKTFASVCYPYDDERVVKEKVRISNMTIETCRAQILLVDQLENKLPREGKRVNSISFALNKHTCLGIYGSNHAGKSHVLRQLVGATGYWFGEVYIAGFNRKKEMSSALKHVGYCPQSRGFHGLVSPTELFRYFLMLYGINRSNHLNFLRALSVSLQLRKYMNSRICELPTNIKRRINVAVALIAGKKILIFDEPTRGLPTFDRLLIWNVIKTWRRLGNTIIFTTNESLELKELADVAVTVNDGEMLCYDNPHNMEYQYNFGFYLEIKLHADGLTLEEVEENLNTDVENLNRFVNFLHDESELVYRCGCVIKYYIPVENVIYSYIFGSMEKNRNRLNIDDYTLTPFSLNRVLRSLQKARKDKKRNDRSRTRVLKDPKTLPRRY